MRPRPSAQDCRVRQRQTPFTRAVERSFGWLNRFRRLARDYERLPETLAGLPFVVFAMLMLVHANPVR
ncbi:transposase [Paraburkholderia sp. LEh10]|uniref:transposase n=1 Tax=Paraburkholderia sp. LEh10 TaxID=2821353 RepID=UPI0028ABB14F|nr:transposase [Paraburkholderia sp. LEh10]